MFIKLALGQAFILGSEYLIAQLKLKIRRAKMNYTTQMDAAKKGIITKKMQGVSEKEGINIETLMELIAKGKVVIPANKNHKNISAEGIGQGLRTKINVNLGV